MRAQITILKDNLIHNYKEIKKHTNKEIIGVVKSNAYGLGIIEVSNILYSQGLSFFAVATIEEAIVLRKSNIMCPILLLEETYDFNIAYQYQITLSVCSIHHLEEMIKSNIPLVAHIALDTGMNRLGLTYNEFKSILDIKYSNLKIKGLFTHIASRSSYSIQKQVFERAVKLLPNKNNIVIHMNTSFYLNDIPSYVTHIRIGMAIYGCSNIPPLELKETLILKAPIIRRKSVKKGDKIGYDNIGIIKEDGYIYTLPIGYADGWDKGRLTIGYKDGFLMQNGLTCMDYLMMFSSKKYEEKEMIELISPSLTCNQLSKIYNTSPYEIISSLSYRIKRKVE